MEARSPLQPCCVVVMKETFVAGAPFGAWEKLELTCACHQTPGTRTLSPRATLGGVPVAHLLQNRYCSETRDGLPNAEVKYVRIFSSMHKP
jgi:hypothetical protein